MEESKRQNWGQQTIMVLDLSDPKSFHTKKKLQPKKFQPKKFPTKKISDQIFLLPKQFSDQIFPSDQKIF